MPFPGLQSREFYSKAKIQFQLKKKESDIYSNNHFDHHGQGTQAEAVSRVSLQLTTAATLAW